MSVSPFYDLPKELMWEIAAYLSDPTEFSSLSIVSRRMQEVVNDAFSSGTFLWSKHSFSLRHLRLSSLLRNLEAEHPRRNARGLVCRLVNTVDAICKRLDEPSSVNMDVLTRIEMIQAKENYALECIWKDYKPLEDIGTAAEIDHWMQTHPTVLASTPELTCYLSNIQCLPQQIALFTGLQKLSLTMNRIVSLSMVYFPATLQSLRLGHNTIGSLAGVQFPVSLQELFLNNNEISSVTGAVFPDGLLKLNLSHNQITSLVGAQFPAALQVIMLNHNKISSLGGVTIAEYRKMELTGNPIPPEKYARVNRLIA